MSDKLDKPSSCAKPTAAQELLKQKVIARWDNEGGAGPDGPQEGHSIPVSSPINSAPILTGQQRWSQRLGGGVHVLIRPITKLDASAERAFIEGLSANTMRMRFMAQIQHPSEAFISRLTNLDGIHDVALVAVTKDGAAEKIVGVSRYSRHATENRCECALAVSDDWQHKGLGTALMRHLIEIAKAQGLALMESTEFAENLDMRTLLHELGFHLRSDPDDSSQVIYSLVLR